MKKLDFDNLGNVHKKFEQITQTSLIPELPFVVRLDGRAFHTYTKGLKRQFDERLSNAMIETTIYLVGQWNAKCGYTQSDEISLIFELPEVFDGRIQKITSLFSAAASVKFNQLAKLTIPEKADSVALFDSRVIQYPSLKHIEDYLLWRETDATRNSLSMAASAYYSTKDLHKAGYTKKHDMLHAKGINWNDYPTHFKRGTYVAKRAVKKMLTSDELSRIPGKHRNNLKEIEFTRNVVQVVEMQPITTVSNFLDVVINGYSDKF